MPTFMDWLDEVGKVLEGDIREREARPEEDFPFDEGYLPLGQLIESLAAVEFAGMLYEAYIEQTQIEELADVEGVGA